MHILASSSPGWQQVRGRRLSPILHRRGRHSWLRGLELLLYLSIEWERTDFDAQALHPNNKHIRRRHALHSFEYVQ